VWSYPNFPQGRLMSTTPETVETEPQEESTTKAQTPEPIGVLEPSEMQLLDSLRKSSQRIVLEVGQLEVRKARLMGMLSDVDEKAQKVMENAARRFGIDPDENQQWSITPEGKMFITGVMEGGTG